MAITSENDARFLHAIIHRISALFQQKEKWFNPNFSKVKPGTLILIKNELHHCIGAWVKTSVRDQMESIVLLHFAQFKAIHRALW